MTQQYADVSSFQGSINWPAYRAWSPMVCMKATEGVGYTDPKFMAYRSGALGAGMQSIFYYHYARPDLGNSAIAEANWFHSVVGNIRPGDAVMLDYEQNSSALTAAWALEWLAQVEAIFGHTPLIYSYLSFIEGHLQDARLASYPLVYANWQYTPTERPAAPAPWKSYEYLQYTDRGTVPGISGTVDVDIYLGGSMSNIPTGWKDDGSTLTAPNGHKVVLGFREHVLNNNWNPGNQPLEEEWHADPLEYSNLSLGVGQKQCFTWTTLEYTAARGVFEAYQGQEIVALLALLAKAQQPAPVDTSAVAADIHAIADAIVAPVAKALADLGKL